MALGTTMGRFQKFWGVRPRSLTLLQQAVESRELQRIWGRGRHEKIGLWGGRSGSRFCRGTLNGGHSGIQSLDFDDNGSSGSVRGFQDILEEGESGLGDG